MIKLPHIITLMLWAFGLVNLFEPFNGLFGLIASFILYLLLIAHLVEIFIFNNKIKFSNVERYIKILKSNFPLEESMDEQTY